MNLEEFFSYRTTLQPIEV